MAGTGIGSSDTLDRGLKKAVDWKLVICYLLLVFIGWANIYASVHSMEPSSIIDPSCRSGKQFIWMMTAFLLDILILFVFNPKLWEVIATPSYIFVVGLLFAVIYLGVEVKGSRSWFEFGPVRFQPAEISKITTSLLLAVVMSRQNFRLSKFGSFLLVAFIIAFPMFAILMESETGSALVYVGFLFMLYREGLSGWYIVILGMAILLFILTLTTKWWISAAVLGAVCAFYYIKVLRTTRRESRMIRRRALRNTILSFCLGMALIFGTGFAFENILQPHQKARIEVLLGMKEDPSGVGYNVRQSMIAIGSGGFFGKGFLNGTQTTYGFVPEQSTDFIFCTVGEEWGFIGSLVLVAAYVLLLIHLVTMAERQRSTFARFYGYSVASILFFHFLVNVGMVLGLVPVIGIPLPFFSYGGSSLIAFTLLLFVFIRQDADRNALI